MENDKAADDTTTATTTKTTTTTTTTTTSSEIGEVWPGTKAVTGSAPHDKARYDKGLSPSESRRIQAGGTAGLFTSHNRLGGAGAVELRRGNRLDVFGDFGGVIWVPDDPFDLSPADEAAADKLTGTLVVPNTVKPCQPFSVSWEVIGPGDAHARVNSYQLNVGAGPIFGLSSEAKLTQDGLKAAGSEITSMWRSGTVKLWAQFGSGIRELDVTDVTIDDSDCSQERLGLPFPILLLQGTGADTFVERIREEAGEDVTVTVTTDAVAAFSSDGFSFGIGLRLEGSGATIDVDLGMQFMIVPRAGHLAGSFSSPGYRSVDISADLPWYDDLWHTITLGEHNLYSYYGRFRDGLKELADGFASAIGRQVRELPDPDDPEYEELEAEADKAVGTAIDIATQELIVTLCPITSGLVSVVGLFPADVFKLL